MSEEPRVTPKTIVQRISRNKRGLAASLAGVAALALTSAFTLGGFSASIQNSTSTFSSGTIQLEEGNGTTTCFSTGSGSGGTVTSSNQNTSCGINAMTGTLDQVPGGTALVTNLTLTNVGRNAASTGNLTIGSCTAAGASDNNGYVGGDTAGFCGKVNVTIANTTAGAANKCVYPAQAAACPTLSNTYNLSTLAGQSLTLPGLAVAGSATYQVTVQLDNGAASNSDQGLTATLPFTWNISQ